MLRLRCVVLTVLFQMSFAAASRADALDVLSYNIFMRPFFHDGQRVRANYLVTQLSGYDAVVLQEAYDDEIRSLLLARLEKEYPYSTETLGEGSVFGANGGVIIVSKWPIVRESQRVFTDGSLRTVARPPRAALGRAAVRVGTAVLTRVWCTH